MIPPLPPDASNLAEGLVINSTRSTISEGIWSRVRVVGLPSTKIVGAAFLNVTLPSMSTFTEGMFFMISVADCPVLTKFLSTLNILRSIPISNCGLLDEVTVTLPRSVASAVILIFPKSLSAIPIICCILGAAPG